MARRLTRSQPGPTLFVMTRRRLIGPALLVVAVVGGARRRRRTVVGQRLVRAIGRARRECRRRLERDVRPDRCPDGPARAGPRAVRVRALLGDERRHRHAPRDDAPDDPRPVLGDAHQVGQDRHVADRLQADHRADRHTAHLRGTRPRCRGPARLFELRRGPQPALLRLDDGPGRDHRQPRRAGDEDPTRTASTSTSSSSPTSSFRPTVHSSAGCATRCGRRTPTGRCRRRPRQARPVRPWPRPRRPPARTGSS